MQVLVDGDLFKYRAAFAAQRTEYAVEYYDKQWDEDVCIRCDTMSAARAVAEARREAGAEVVITPHVMVEPEGNATYNAKSMMQTVMGAVEANHDDVIVVLSGPTNFRNDLGTIKVYKGNRDPDHKPVHGPAVEEFLRCTYNSATTHDEEADDYIGYMHYAAWREDPYSSLIVTCDKDLDMIPGMHYNFLHDRYYDVEPHEAAVNFLTQLLTGDSTDNILGCPGIGAKRAEALISAALAEGNDAYQVVWDTYVAKYGLTAYPALKENGQLLWIRREPGQMWLPETHDWRQ